MKRRILLGVDAGSEHHQYTALDESERTVWEARLPNDHGGVDEVLAKVRGWQEEGFEVWAVGEGVRGWLSPLDYRLAAIGCKWVSIHPNQFSRFRETLSVQPGKDDRLDSLLLARMLAWQIERGQVRVCDRTQVYFDTLQQIARSFETITKSKVACERHLVCLVREYWPELVTGKNYFTRNDSPCLLWVLSTCPTPEKLARVGAYRLTRRMTQLTGRDASPLAHRLLEDAKRLKGSLSIPDERMVLVQTLAHNLAALVDTLKQLESQLENQLLQHPFGKWLLDQEGIGVRTAGCFLGEAGNLDRFQNEAQLARYAGNGATRYQSGKLSQKHRDSRRYNHHLKRVTLILADCRARTHPASLAYLQTRKSQGAKHWPTIKKLARHQIRFLWKGWQQVVHGQEIPLSDSGENLISSP